MTISVVLCTKDRPYKLHQSMRSILPQLIGKDELIVVDSSKIHSAKTVVHGMKHARILYIATEGGLSVARNTGVARAKGDIIAFTDDDCVASPGWLTALRKAFSSYSRVGIIFGRTASYRPERHKGLISISLSPKRTRKVYKGPPANIFGIGTGNNMGVRRDVFRRIGVFLPWLGVGSMCPGAEEEEFAYRALTRQIEVLREPEVVIFHDRWITRQERRDIIAAYSAGYFGLLTWYSLAGDRRAQKLLGTSVRVLLQGKLSFQQIFFCVKGVSVATWERMTWGLRKIFFNDRHDAVKFVLP